MAASGPLPGGVEQRRWCIMDRLLWPGREEGEEEWRHLIRRHRCKCLTCVGSVAASTTKMPTHQLVAMEKGFVGRGTSQAGS